MTTSKTRRPAAELNASSMADIAFLLLVFFLVTTILDVEKGILVKLPPIDNQPQEGNERNILSVKINAANQLMVEGKPMEFLALRQQCKAFIMNFGKDPALSDSPQMAIIFLQNDRSTSYATYVTVYNELKAAYNELWDEAAKRKFGRPYGLLSNAKKQEIRDAIPLIISEGELTDFDKE